MESNLARRILQLYKYGSYYILVYYTDLFKGVFSIVHFINPIILIFLSSCKYLEVQAQLASLLGLHGTANPGIPITSIVSLSANTTETAYKQFCDDLYRIGVTEDTVRQKEDEILEILRSQGMVSSSQIGDRGIGGKDHVLEAAYKSYCEDLYRMGFTDDMILPLKDQILGILRSRGMVARSNTGGSIEDKGQFLEAGFSFFI